jgi:hypothetical protein
MYVHKHMYTYVHYIAGLIAKAVFVLSLGTRTVNTTTMMLDVDLLNLPDPRQLRDCLTSSRAKLVVGPRQVFE